MSKNADLRDYWKRPPSQGVRDTQSVRSSDPARPRAGRRRPACSPITISPNTPSPRPSLDSLDSPDSFPPSPFHPASPAVPSSPPAQPAVAGARKTTSYGGCIRDSDEDEDDIDDDAESLREAVQSGQPLLSMSSSSLSSFSSSARLTTTTAITTHPPSCSSDRSSATPPQQLLQPQPQQTKRRANTLLSSPLALRRAKHARVNQYAEPPKHKFDMQALLRHAEQDDAAEAAARRLSDAFAESQQADTGGSSRPGESKMGALGLAQMAMLDGLVSGDEGGEAGGSDHKLPLFNKDRLKRAFDRTEVDAVSEQWYFFKEHFVSSPAPRRSFPARAATGRWAFLKDPVLRKDCFASGIVRQALASAPPPVASKPRLPDELFLWILDEACVEPLASLRAEYAAVLALCPEQVRRFVDAERLVRLFQMLGPRWESIDLSARLALVPALRHPYPSRDWAPLRAQLALLAALADGPLSLDAAQCATKLLLRLGIDRVVEENLELLEGFQEAVRRVVTRISAADWDDFCFDVCSSLHSSIQKPSLWWQTLACLPADVPACHELRRRLASVFLFDDPARARQDPRRQVASQSLGRLAARDDLVVTADTHYPDLSALINMMDMYVDSAGREAVMGGTGAQTAQQFNADVDDLARRLRAVGRGIEATGGGHVSRLDSKTALDRLQIRLTHAVRTKQPGKKSIFDRLGGSGGGDGDGEEPHHKQRDIRSFLQMLSKKKVDAS